MGSVPTRTLPPMKWIVKSHGLLLQLEWYILGLNDFRTFVNFNFMLINTSINITRVFIALKKN